MTRRKILTGLVVAAMVTLAIVAVPVVHAESGCHKGTETTEVQPPRQ